MSAPQLDAPGEAPALAIEVAGQRHLAQAAGGAVVIGRELPAQIRITEPGVSRTHLRIEPTQGRWTVTDTGSRNGTYLRGERIDSIVVDHPTTVQLGDPAGIDVRLTPTPATLADATPGAAVTEHFVLDAAETTDRVDATIARAGAAVAARREELGLSQRKLADDHIVSQSVLVKFERGVHWPRASTIAKIEAYLRWPPGLIHRIRRGAAVPDDESTEVLSPTIQVAVLIDASEIALGGLQARAAVLPPSDSPRFSSEIAVLLAELRRLERTVAAAARTSTRRPELARLLGDVRRASSELIAAAAQAPTASLGQRLAAVRNANRLSIDETASAAGVPAEDIHAAESDRLVSADAATSLEQFIDIVSDER
ncbi:FHA domain-containing protein [Mycobacterium sp. pW049]|uniref:FHA domain-containing protein n=1 Tax=[Mycobacterium] bulgaricum TaxID=3238985 RepID=UPI00351B1C74